jgi:hypothetical protein
VTRPRRSYALFALASIVAVVAGCGGSGDDSNDELTGLIIDVRGHGDDVRSFSLRTGDQTYDIRIAPEVDYGFRLGHLRTHEASLYPVRCRFERREGRLYALEIADA